MKPLKRDSPIPESSPEILIELLDELFNHEDWTQIPVGNSGSRFANLWRNNPEFTALTEMIMAVAADQLIVDNGCNMETRKVLSDAGYDAFVGMRSDRMVGFITKEDKALLFGD